MSGIKKIRRTDRVPGGRTLVENPFENRTAAITALRILGWKIKEGELAVVGGQPSDAPQFGVDFEHEDGRVVGSSGESPDEAFWRAAQLAFADEMGVFDEERQFRR